MTWWREGHRLVSRWTHTESGDLTWVAHVATLYQTWTRWLRPCFWRRVFAAPSDRHISRRTAVWCRLRGHPNGAIFFNSYGYEPDDRCKDCYDDLSYGPSPQYFTRRSLKGLREAVRRG